ncbi:MAG TPA: DUF86 domain-containing protein [Bacillota bacterium]|nr:DUF86 domain-containing protein [Bacillota bacterium]
MYFVDRKKIMDILDYMDSILEDLSKGEPYHTFLQKRALERMAHVLIESVLDVGNMMIDGFIMRDPGGFDDIIDILVDEKVIPEPEQDTYKQMIQLREMIVKNYMSVNHDFLFETLIKNKPVLDKFSTHIKSYLDNELGVVHAFSNN